MISPQKLQFRFENKILLFLGIRINIRLNYQLRWIPWSNWIACAHWMLDFCFVMSCSLVNSVLFSWTEFWKVGSTKEHDINSSDNIFMYNGSLSLAPKFVHWSPSGTGGRILRAVTKMYHQTVVVILWSWSNNCSKIFKNGDLHKINALSLWPIEQHHHTPLTFLKSLGYYRWKRRFIFIVRLNFEGFSSVELNGRSIGPK